MIDPDLIAQILRYGELAAPEEACGVAVRFTGDPKALVLQTPNRHEPASERIDRFLVTMDDVVNVLAPILDERQATFDPDEGFLVWHTHPNGQVGPSKKDMEAARALRSDPTHPRRPRMLVVSLPGGEAAVF